MSNNITSFTALGFYPKAVFFDLDGTLVDSYPDILAAITQSAQSIGLAKPDPHKVKAWIGNGALNLAERVLANSFTTPAQQHPQTQALYDGFMQAYGEVNNAYSQPCVGAMTLLQSLHKAGIKMAIITNKSSRFTPAVLRHFGMLDYFALVYAGDTFNKKKPHPMPLLEACRAFDIHPDSALMVGDSSNDILAAQAAGIKSVGIRGGYNHGEDISICQPTWVVDDLSVLAGVS